jgi:hypothetical protein
MKISFALVIATTLVFFQMPARASTIYPTQRGGVACTMTLRLSEFRVSVERSCPSTRASCTCDLRGQHRIAFTQITIAHSKGHVDESEPAHPREPCLMSEPCEPRSTKGVEQAKANESTSRSERATASESTIEGEGATAHESTKTSGGLDELTLRLAVAVDVGAIRDVRSEIIELIT